MYQNEPVFVVEVDEILNRVEVAEGDGAVLVKSLPVVERITVIAQDRWPAEASTNIAEQNLVRTSFE